MRTRTILVVTLFSLLLFTACGAGSPGTAVVPTQAPPTPGILPLGEYNPFGFTLPTTTPGSLVVKEMDINRIYATTQAEYLAVQREVAEATTQAQIITDARHAGSTATAEFWANLEKSQAATSTAQAQEVIATGTAQAQEVIATGTAQAIVVANTRQANDEMATAQAQAIIATAEARRAERAERSANFWTNTVPVMMVMLVVTFAAIAVWLMIRNQNMKMESLAIRDSLVETRAGTIVFLVDASTGRRIPQLISPEQFGTPKRELSPPKTQAHIIDGDRIPYNAYGEPQEPITRDPHATAQARANRSLARWLVHDAMRVAGPNADYIPGHRKLDNWNSERWSRAINLLRDANVIETIQGKGTYLIGQWETLTDVMNGLERGKIEFVDYSFASPYPENTSIYA